MPHWIGLALARAGKTALAQRQLRLKRSRSGIYYDDSDVVDAGALHAQLFWSTGITR